MTTGRFAAMCQHSREELSPCGWFDSSARSALACSWLLYAFARLPTMANALW